MTMQALALKIADEMELYSVNLENRTTEHGTLEFRAYVFWCGDHFGKPSEWGSITDAHLASIKMLTDINNELMRQAALPEEEVEDDCSACGGSGGAEGAECPLCNGSGVGVGVKHRPPRALNVYELEE